MIIISNAKPIIWNIHLYWSFWKVRNQLITYTHLVTLKTIPRLVNDWIGLAGVLSVKYGRGCVVISFFAVLGRFRGCGFQLDWRCAADSLLLWRLFCFDRQKRHHLCKVLVVDLSVTRHTGFTQQLVNWDINIIIMSN